MEAHAPKCLSGFKGVLCPLTISCSTGNEITQLSLGYTSREAQGKWWGGCKGGKPIQKDLYHQQWQKFETILGHGPACVHDHMNLIESVQ